MADKHSNFNYEMRELKFGASFTNNKSSQYHTIKYDFKPASVDVNKMATVDVGTNNQVTVTVPHLDGAGVPQTVFKGNQRPYSHKDCVLVIDRVTGEFTLEKLSSNIQVKKTRQESAQKPRPLTPVTADFTNTTQRSTSRTRVTTNRRSANAGPTSAQPNSQARFNGSAAVQKTPPNMVRSPQRVKTSPPQAAPWSGGNSTLASLPMIGLEDGPAPPQPAPAPQPAHNGYKPDRPDRPERLERPDRPDRPDRGHNVNPHAQPTAHNAVNKPPQQQQQQPPQQQPPQQDDSSSSSSSDSGSDSDSASDSDDDPAPHQQTLTNGNTLNSSLPSDVLNDDLCLSESGSDSD